MKKLDLYIIKKFLTTFFFVLLLFSLIASIIDLTERVDQFIEHEVPIKVVIFDYYLNFIPYIDSLLSPVFIFISVIFFTSRMAYNSEFVAMLSSGISFYRLLVPYMIAAGLLAALLLFANHQMVPNANKNRLAFEYAYIKSPYKKVNRNIYMQVKEGEYVYMENFTHKQNVGYKFSYEIIKDGQLESKLRAEKIEWINDLEKWRINNYYIRNFNDLEEAIEKGRQLDTAFSFRPMDFEKRISLNEEMNTAELKEHIEKLRLRGANNIEYYSIELHRRTSDAFTVFILTLIGMSLASRKVRGGLGLHIVLGFLLSSIYIIFMRFSTTFSTNGDLSPLLSVWIPNIIFAALAIMLARKAPK